MDLQDLPGIASRQYGLAVSCRVADLSVTSYKGPISSSGYIHSLTLVHAQAGRGAA